MIHASKTFTLIVSATSLFGVVALATPTERHRYPFDPACAWGRLSDGKGLILRCLTREESERLSKPPTTGAAAASGANPSTTGTATTAGAQGTPKSGAPASTENAPVATNAGSGTVAPPPVTPTNPTAPSGVDPTASTTAAAGTKDPLSAEVVSVTADDGELPLAKRKLSAPSERYAQCVFEHGGLTAAVGEVTVRFLVRERGRAEGTNVEKFHGLSQAAAACIAEVVDRRPTGTPDAPVVGATAIIRLKKRAAK